MIRLLINYLLGGNMKDLFLNIIVLLFLLGIAVLAVTPNKKFNAVYNGVEKQYKYCALEHDNFIAERKDLSIEELINLVNQSCSEMGPNGPARPEWR